MEILRGPRRRCVTLRLPREVYYELDKWCDAHNLSLATFLESVVCSLSLHKVEIALSQLSAQEVTGDG